MTDHRVTDLSYGHLGEATYDIEESQWTFSIDYSTDQRFQQLLPFSLCQPPSIQNAPQSSKKPSNIARSQLKYLTSSRPETFPANIIASLLSRADSISQQNPVRNGQLLSVGGAVNVEHLPGYRTEPVIAMPHGEAGHTLRLLRPNREKHGWGKRSSVGLAVLDAASLDYGHWTGIGGTIHQVIYADDGNVSSTWLAVRQAFVTTIFRPMYYGSPVPAVAPTGHGTTYPPSRLGANPVAVLTAERTGSVQHVDVTFNPFYARQLSVVDDVGSWSIWDIEGRSRKRATLELIAGKSGQIYDGYVHDPILREPDSADGWHRLLWVSNVSTLVVCNRRHIAVFDVKSKPKRLQSIDILSASSTDWILDVKRSASNLSHLFVLTSSRILWVAITALEEDKDGVFGAKIISSCRHFRDPNDTSMKLVAPNGDSDLSTLISSGKSRLVNFYRFSTNIDGVSSPNSSQGSFTFNRSLNGHTADSFEELQSVYFLGAALTSIPSYPSGPELEIFEKGVKFYQAFVLSANFGLFSTLCSVSNALQNIHICAPDSKMLLRKVRHVGSRHALADEFVVPDGGFDEEAATFERVHPSRLNQLIATQMKPEERTRFRINWKAVFKQAFLEESFHANTQEKTLPHIKTMVQLLEIISSHISDGRKAQFIPMSTFFELCQIPEISDQLEQASPALQEFLNTLPLDQGPDSNIDLVLSSLTSCPSITFPKIQDSPFSNLTQVYDQVGDQWMASLPLKVSNLSRLAKFKIARKIAVELCLASIAVSLRQKSSHMAELPEHETGEFSLPILSKSSELLEAPPPMSSSRPNQSSLPDPSFTLPTPARTPSLHSHESATFADTGKDPAILRLQQYALSIKLPSNIGLYPLLSQWPATPGTSPDQYKWEPLQKASPENEDQEGDNHRRRRDEAHRRRRTEIFLNQDSTTTAEATSVSLPAFTPFGSQPEIAQHAASSQMVDELPMTQPDRGLFGSRSAHSGKEGQKKHKKRRAAGF